VAQDGTPLETIGLDPVALRVWQCFRERDSLFEQSTACASSNDPAALIIRDLVQADGNVLIDQAGNFTVYQTRVSPVVADFSRQNELHTQAGQAAAGPGIAFPMGHRAGADHPAAPASILLKTTWRIVTPDPAKDYLTRRPIIDVPAKHSAAGRPAGHGVTLGMVGMHTVTRTHSGNGGERIWSTFKHRANAPVAAHARGVNSIYSDDPFPGGSTPPSTTTHHNYFAPDCPNCPKNTPPIAATWADAPPFAVTGKDPAQPSQIVRCWKIFKSTAAVNALWQARLSGTVLANYMVISTQWRGANNSPLFEHGEGPRFLTNTRMESFQQDANDGPCLGRHAEATTAVGTAPNFSFLLQKAD